MFSFENGLVHVQIATSGKRVYVCVCVCGTNSDSEWVSGIRFLQWWDAHEDMDKGGSSSACLYSRHSQNAALGTWYRISFLVHASAPSPSSPQNHEPQCSDTVIEESEDTQKDKQNSKEEERTTEIE